MFLRTFKITAIAVALGYATFANAADLAMPTGEPVLVVSGKVAVTNQADTAVFDRTMLAVLPVTTYETTTIWTEGTQEFTGVLLSDLLQSLGATGSVIEATAINDYAIEIPVEDARPEGALVAYLMNGQEMSVRDKGPLWIVYPYDSNADFQSEVIYSRSIWQLDRLRIID